MARQLIRVHQNEQREWRSDCCDAPLTWFDRDLRLLGCASCGKETNEPMQQETADHEACSAAALAQLSLCDPTKLADGAVLALLDAAIAHLAANEQTSMNGYALPYVQESERTRIALQQAIAAIQAATL